MGSLGARSRAHIRAAAAAAASAVVGGLGLAPGCTCHRGPPPELGKDLGAVSAPPPDARPLLELARAIVDHQGREGATGTSPAPARRVALVLWGAGPEPLVATASGATTSDAVAAAAGVIATKVTAPVGVGTGRLELDVPTSAQSADVGALDELALTDVGTEGLLVARDDGRAAVVTPGEIVDRRLFHEGRPAGLDREKIGALLASRAGVTPPELDGMRAYRFRADVHVESASRDAALPVFRGMVTRPAEVGVSRLLDGVRRGADYLVRTMRPDGRFIYLYHPLEDREDRTYGWLRHAATVYALLEAYGELGNRAYLEKSELALAAMRSRLRDEPESLGKYLIDTTDEEQQKVGGAGLALVALAEHAATTGQRDDLELMRALARFILHQQYPDGHFRANSDLEKGGERLKREPVYYAGEGLLALLRLYALDPQSAYLDAARKGADWVVNVRDGAASEDNQEHDHWLSYALNELYRLTRDDTYLEHANKIARAILRKQRGADAPSPDLVGTFYDGLTTPAATRLEAFDADIALARFAGKPQDWLLGPARVMASTTLGQQFDDDDAYWLPDPAKARGGVRESLFVADIEIDYVQHAMSAWLHLARELRDPAYGATGVPSQDAVR